MTTPISPKSKRIPRFVEEYVKDSNGTRSALAAGWPPSWADVAASQLLALPSVQKLIEEQRAKISERVVLDAAFVLQRWMEVATADPTKISTVRRVNCRYCWGVAHEYQWKAREYAKACDTALNYVNPRNGRPEPKQPPNCSGGFGFDKYAEPSPDCPECDGEGQEDVVFNDIASLGPNERALIANIKRTKDGLEVKTYDRLEAVSKLADYMGMIVKKQELTGKNGAPLVPPSELPTDPAVLAQLYANLTRG